MCLNTYCSCIEGSKNSFCSKCEGYLNEMLKEYSTDDMVKSNIETYFRIIRGKPVEIANNQHIISNLTRALREYKPNEYKKVSPVKPDGDPSMVGF